MLASDEWCRRGECRGMDPDLFFPTTGDIPKEARSACERCDVMVPCLEYALVHEPHGFWGGMSERQRKRERQRRRMVEQQQVLF